MNCNDFLALHTEWLDDVIEPSQADRLKEHAVGCASCSRYDFVVRRGLDLARTLLPVVEVSTDFGARVRHRIYHERDSMTRRRNAFASAFGLAASVILVAAAAGALAVLDGRTPVVEGSVVFAAAPALMSDMSANAVAVTSEPALSRKEPAGSGSALDQREADAHDVNVADTTRWPVYSRGAVAAVFPSSRNEVVARPADFRRATPIVAPLLIRY